jgi:prepilin peptidase CpaA
MMLMAILITIALLTVAGFYDYRLRRIPNYIVLLLITFWVIYGVFTNGIQGFMHSMSGLGVGFCLLLLPYLFGVMGAGDVKLLAAMGSALGPRYIFEAFLITGVAGGVYAVVLLVSHGVFVRAMKSIWITFLLLLGTKRFSYAPVDNEGALPKLPYGIAIGVGSVSAMIMSAHGVTVLALFK